MKNIFKLLYKEERGIAIYIAVTVTAALVLVSFAIINLAIKQVSISSASRDSQAAFYAADSGVECALYWDLKNSTFATTTASADIICNGKNTPTSRLVGNPQNATTTFDFDFTTGDPATSNPYCVNVSVSKFYESDELKTKIEARGYNSCDENNARRVERAIMVNY
jgi:Tfp pilus assembly protein PilX